MPLPAPDIGHIPVTGSDLIHRYLRQQIVKGAIADGQPIRQDEVASLFGTSKIPVREALKRLEAEGLITFHRNRGAVVATLTEPEIAQIFEARAILESNLLRLSVPLMTPQTVTDAQDLSEAFAHETDPARWADLNWAFHSCLYRDAQRPFLVEMVRSLNDRLERYLRVQLTVSEGHATAVTEHRGLVAACRNGDADGSAAILFAHIMNALDSLQRNAG